MTEMNSKWQEWEDSFDFSHSDECKTLRFADFEKNPWADCYCQLKDIKSFIRSLLHSHDEELVREIEAMMPTLCHLCKHPVDCKDHYEENGVIFCPHNHHTCNRNSTASCIDIVCSETELAKYQALSAVQEFIRKRNN